MSKGGFKYVYFGVAEAARKGSKTATARLEALIFFFLLWLVLGFLFEFPAGEFKKKKKTELIEEGNEVQIFSTNYNFGFFS